MRGSKTMSRRLKIFFPPRDHCAAVTCRLFCQLIIIHQRQGRPRSDDVRAGCALRVVGGGGGTQDRIGWLYRGGLRRNGGLLSQVDSNQYYLVKCGNAIQIIAKMKLAVAFSNQFWVNAKLRFSEKLHSNFSPFLYWLNSRSMQEVICFDYILEYTY